MRTLASILMSVLKDHTGAHPIRGVSIHKARTVAAAFLVGETMVIILVLTLTNVLKDVTVARPTHTASIRRDHIDATATGVTINLEVAVMPTVVRKLNTTTLPPIPAILHITLPNAVFRVGEDAGNHGGNERQKV